MEFFKPTQESNEEKSVSTYNEETLDIETQNYLQEVEAELYKTAKIRSKVDGGLLFVSCQVSSVSMSWFLYSLQVSLVPCCVIASTIALLPGLITISDTFGFSISSEQWDTQIGDKPLVGIIKLGLGILTSYCGNSRIAKLETDSKFAIAQAYEQIKAHNHQNYSLTVPLDFGILTVCVLTIVGVWVKIRYFRPTTNKADEEIT